jgi:Galactose oxidase, central domain/Kelch motif
MKDSYEHWTPRSFKIARVVLPVVVAACGFCGCGGSSAPPPSSRITVTVSPSSITVIRGTMQTFSAKVDGTTHNSVSWSVQESSGGTIDSKGVYAAPRDTNGTFHVVATSQADPRASGVGEVIVPLPQVAVSPAAITLGPRATHNFVAEVTGLADVGVIWSVREMIGGQINGTGFYTAPSASGFYHVTATSAEDSTVAGNSTVSVTNSSALFSPAGSLQQGRGLHTATRLNDSKILIAGGANRASDRHCIGGIASAELYNPVNFSSATTGPLNRPRFAHAAVLLPGGKVFVSGGFGNTSDCMDEGVQPENTAELYDPATGSFARTGDMAQSRGGHTATLLADGTVLVAGGGRQANGGTVLSGAELYDPNTGSFTPTGNMTLARFRHTATLLKNGKVLIAGGLLTSPSANPTASAEVYDPATGAFTATGSMAIPRENHTATLLADGRVLIVGGLTTQSDSSLKNAGSAEVYNPSAGTFSDAGQMAAARSGHAAALLPNGNVLICGGGDDDFTAELYDPATNSFTITGNMQVGRSGHTATVLLLGSVVVIGGGSFTPIATAEIYSNQAPFDY